MQTDKLWHFVGGLLIALVVGLPFSILGMAWVLMGLLAALIAGIIKEAVDEYKKRTNRGGTGWDWLDLAATVGGGFVGMILEIILIRIL